MVPTSHFIDIQRKAFNKSEQYLPFKFVLFVLSVFLDTSNCIGFFNSISRESSSNLQTDRYLSIDNLTQILSYYQKHKETCQIILV